MDEIPDIRSSRTIFKGRVFDVRIDEVQYQDGKTHAVDVVEHRESYAIIATTPDDRIVLVQLYRHPLRRVLWEIPAGVAEEGEDSRSGALRELQEETGYTAASIRPLGSMAMTPGFCDEILSFYHAAGLTAGEQNLDEDERITVASYTLDEAQRLVDTGQIADAKTILALLWMRGSRGELVPRNGR